MPEVARQPLPPHDKREALLRAFGKYVCLPYLGVVAGAGLLNRVWPDSSTISYDAATQVLTESSETHENIAVFGEARWARKEWDLSLRQVCNRERIINIAIPMVVAPLRKDRSADWTGLAESCRTITMVDTFALREALQKAAPHLPEAQSWVALYHKLAPF